MRFVFPLFSQKEKSATYFCCKLLIFSVDQLGLEICRALRDPLTERKKPLGPLDYESRKVRFHEIPLFASAADYQCFIKLSSSVNLK